MAAAPPKPRTPRAPRKKAACAPRVVTALLRPPARRGPPAIAPGLAFAATLAILVRREQELKDLRLTDKTARINKGTWDAYAADCARFGCAPYPIVRPVALYTIDVKCDNADNATSAHQWVSQMYSHARYALSAPPFSKDDSLYWNDVYPGLYKEYGRHTQSPPALGAEHLIKIYDAAKPDPRVNLEEWVNWTHIKFAYHATMRPNEHTGPDCGAFAGCLSFLPGDEGARWDFLETKGTRMRHASDGERTFIRAVTGPLDVVADLRTHLDLFRLHEVPTHPLFPAMTGRGELTDKFMSGEQFNKMLRGFTARAGITTDFTARCLRSGHRTDLRNSGVPADIVNLLGRWKSESASLMYQRTNSAIVRWLPTSVGGRNF